MEEEIWKSVKNYEGIYEVSSWGRIKSLRRKGRKKDKILKTGLARGYPIMVLCNAGIYANTKIHKLVAIAFLSYDFLNNRLMIDHKDGNRQNNRVSNLRIVTNRENLSTCFRKDRDGFSSKYTGVRLNKRLNKWISEISIKGKTKYLGLYEKEKDAHIAYQNELIKITNAN